MSRDLEKAFLEQGRRLFELCRLYIDGGLRPEEKDRLAKEIEDAFDKWEEADNRALFEEITANLEEPMSEQQRERYCFSLLTPFGEYSSTLYPKWLIDKTQESINIELGRGGDISYLEREIDNVNRKAEKYRDLVDYCGLEGDIVERDFHYFAHKVSVEYGILLDAAFVMHGLDLKQLQNKCGVWIKQNWQHELRVLDVGHYVGSEALAEKYLSRLPQEQPEPQHEQQGEQKQHKQLGRKRKALKDLIVPIDKETIYSRLQQKMKGASPDVAMDILISNIKNKILLKPSFGAFKDAFPDVEIPEATYYTKLKKAGLGQE